MKYVTAHLLRYFVNCSSIGKLDESLGTILPPSVKHMQISFLLGELATVTNPTIETISVLNRYSTTSLSGMLQYLPNLKWIEYNHVKYPKKAIELSNMILQQAGGANFALYGNVLAIMRLIAALVRDFQASTVLSTDLVHQITGLIQHQIHPGVENTAHIRTHTDNSVYFISNGPQPPPNSQAVRCVRKGPHMSSVSRIVSKMV